MAHDSPRVWRPSKNREPLQEYLTIGRQNSDRFIALRGSMDFDVARYLLTENKKENNADDIPAKETYKKELAARLFKDSNIDIKKSRILTFKAKVPDPQESFQSFFSECASTGSVIISSKLCHYIPKSAERTLDASDLVDGYYLNLLDWSISNVLSIALAFTVYLWDATQSITFELLTVDDDVGPITSVN